MISQILVPMNDSEMAACALEFACQSFPEAELTVLAVVGGPSSYMGQAIGLSLADDTQTEAADLAEPVFETARKIATETEHEISTEVAMGHPTQAIVDRAADYDLVVIGAHSRNLGARILLGNVAEQVTERSPVPVTVVR